MFRAIFLSSLIFLPLFGFGQFLSKEYHRIIEESRTQDIDLLIDNLNSEVDSSADSLLLAELYFLKGRNDKAGHILELLEGNKQMQNHPNPELYARWLKNYGLVFWNQGKTDRALEFLQQSLLIFGQIEDVDLDNRADVFNNLGLVFVKTEPGQAVTFYNKALKIYAESPEDNIDKIVQLSINISLAEINQGNQIEALRILNKALGSWGSNHEDGLPTEAFIKASIGGVYLETNQLVLAKDYLEEAKHIYLQNYGKRNSELANVYAQLSELALRQQSYETALDLIQKALKANSFDFEPSNFPQNPKITDANKLNIQLSLLMRKAIILESFYYGYSLKKSHLEIALNTIDLADNVLENIRIGTTNKKDLMELSDLAAELYEDGQRIALQLQDVTLIGQEFLFEAFQYAEKSKSSLLKTAVVESEARSFAGIPSQILEQERVFSAELAYLNTQVALAEDTSKLNLLRNQYFQLKQNYKKFVIELGEQYPEYFNLKHRESSVSIQNIQERLGNNEAILEYSLARKSNYINLYIITKTKISHHRIYKLDQVLKFLRAYRNTLTYNLQSSFQSVAHELYKYLFPKKINSDIDKLVVVPDGELATIPFEALIKEQFENDSFYNLDYLIKSYNINYAYAASLYNSNEAKNYGSEALLISPIEFGTAASKLPASEQEGEHFRKWCEQQSYETKALLRNEATKDNFKNSSLDNFRFIHLATHGTVDLEFPDLSGVYFNSRLKNDFEDDNILYVGEIYGLSINAELVVLSACETGLGKINRGEGVMGLGQAFAFSGADNLILSLWKVADESTSLLMQSFYQNNLGQNDFSFSSGLRKAKLSMISSDYSAPYYWAPFILWGK